MVENSMTGIWRLKKIDKKSRSGYAAVKWWNILPRYISHEVAFTRLENPPMRMKMIRTNQKPGKLLSNQRPRIWNQSFLILKKMKFLNLELNSNQEPVLFNESYSWVTAMIHIIWVIWDESWWLWRNESFKTDKKTDRELIEFWSFQNWMKFIIWLDLMSTNQNQVLP